MGTSGLDKTLIERWDGTAWSVVPSPNPGKQYDFLNSVSAASATDAWTVGTETSVGDGVWSTLIEHWNGTKWKVVSSPNPVVGGNNDLGGVAAISASDVWVVGGGNVGTTSTGYTVHFDGTTWQVVPGANADTAGAGSVTATGTTDVWAAGGEGPSDSYQAFTEHWDGTAWSPVATAIPTPGTVTSSLQGIDAVPRTGQLWAVGIATTAVPKHSNTLIERYC